MVPLPAAGVVVRVIVPTALMTTEIKLFDMLNGSKPVPNGWLFAAFSTINSLAADPAIIASATRPRMT